MAYRNTASFGKRQEYIAVAELLRRDFDVYMTLVDDQGIDCIIRLDRPSPVYLDIQIKARSAEAKNPGTFAAMTIQNPRPNYFFIFYSEGADTYWVMPSRDVLEKGNINKAGVNAGKCRIVFTNTLKDGTVKPRPKWGEYQDAFHLLNEYQE